MGALDKLSFWRRKTVDEEADIHGCFTLPPSSPHPHAAEVDSPPACAADGEPDQAPA